LKPQSELKRIVKLEVLPAMKQKGSFKPRLTKKRKVELKAELTRNRKVSMML
jgi:hypothetical protein